MNIPYSKKELYRDNIQLKKQLDHATARNAELAIVLETQNKLIDEINAKNDIINKNNQEE